MTSAALKRRSSTVLPASQLFRSLLRQIPTLHLSTCGPILLSALLRLAVLFWRGRFVELRLEVGRPKACVFWSGQRIRLAV